MGTEIYQALGISLGLGLLVGLQREHAASKVAGIRTFPIITLLGTVCAILAESFGGWIVAAGLLAVAALVYIGNVVKRTEADPGQTTEAAALLMFAVGAFLVAGDRTAAVAVGAACAVLLHLKEPLHGIVRRFGPNDLKAVMQFAVISLIVLPILPDRAYGPYEVFNPRETWRMVVLIVGISLFGYGAHKLFGGRAGTLLGGILGGGVSSTATTVSFARRTRETPGAASLAAAVILIASAVSIVRVLVEIGFVASGHFPQMAPPLAVFFAFLALLSAFAFRSAKRDSQPPPEPSNPAELKSAVVFGALYAVVLWLVAAAKDQFGQQGLYAVAVISGLTDLDAITLSVSQMVSAGRVEAGPGWRLILVASLANLVFKGAIAGALGGLPLLRRLAPFFGLSLAAGALLLWMG